MDCKNIMLKKHLHAPAHLFVDNHTYFFTGGVYQKRLFLKDNQAKEIFVENLVKFIDKHGWKLLHWIVLGNHYHFLAYVPDSRVMPELINTLHKTSAFHIMKYLDIHVKPFWYQYWDRCMRNEAHYYRTAMYIMYNPVKHKLVEDLKDYPFSSFYEDIQNQSDDLKVQFRKYDPRNCKVYDEIDGFD